MIEKKDRYVNEMLSYLENKKVFREDERNESNTYIQKVQQWADKWEHNISKDEITWIRKETAKPEKVNGNVKTHIKDNPYRYIVSAKGTSI